MILRAVAWLFPAGLLVMGAGMVSAQTYPTKPVRIVTGDVGGGNDFTARVIAQEITGPLGQPVVVDNRANVIAFDLVAKAPADGYTLLLQGAPFWLGPLMNKVNYDPVRDFSPITLAIRQPNMIVVHPLLPVKSVKELIALAKAKPGQLNYGAASIGSSSHLAGEHFKSLAGVNIVTIVYKSNTNAVTDAISGQVQVLFISAAFSGPFVKSGRLRALAVTSAEPSPLAPGLPTVAASGLPGYQSTSMAGIFAPAKTPAAIINRLNQEMVQALNRDNVKARLFGANVEAVGGSPEQLAATMKAEIERWGKVIKDAGIRFE